MPNTELKEGLRRLKLMYTLSGDLRIVGLGINQWVDLCLPTYYDLPKSESATRVHEQVFSFPVSKAESYLKISFFVQGRKYENLQKIQIQNLNLLVIAALNQALARYS